MRQMTLEPIKQSTIGEKEQDKCCILMHAYGIQSDGTDGPICRAAGETQTERTDLWTQWGKERVGQFERAAWKHIHQHMQIESQWEFAV